MGEAAVKKSIVAARPGTAPHDIFVVSYQFPSAKGRARWRRYLDLALSSQPIQAGRQAGRQAAALYVLCILEVARSHSSSLPMAA